MAVRHASQVTSDINKDLIFKAKAKDLTSLHVTVVQPTSRRAAQARQRTRRRLRHD